MATRQRYETKSGRVTYKVRFRIGSKSCSETFATAKDADRFIQLIDAVGGARARAIINEMDPGDVLNHTVGQAAEMWLEWKSATDSNGEPLRVRSSYTTYRYGQIVRNQILPHLGDKPLNSVNERDVQDWVDDLSTTLSAKTVADAHSVLHSVYKWAGNKARGMAVTDPCTETTLPKKKRNQAKGYTPDEWAIIHAAAKQVSPDAADILLFLVSSGWRWSEASALNALAVDDLGDSGLYVTMGRVMRRKSSGHYEIVDDAKSEAGFRRIKMPTEAAEMIRRRMVGLSPNDLLFTNPQGRRWYYGHFYDSYLKRLKSDPAPNRARIAEVAAEMGLTKKLDLHTLRHAHAAWMVLAGESLAQVQKRMGHEDVRTTIAVYGSLIGDVSSEGLRSFDEMLAGRRALSGVAESIES